MSRNAARRRTAKLPIRGSETLSERLKAQADDPPLSVAAIDIDDFKAINDSHGRLVGDKVLVAVEAVLRGHVPDPGIVVRTHGDAFTCMLPQTPPERALILMEGARVQLEKFQTFGKAKVPARISIGIASYPHHTEDPSQLPEAAAEALERAKREGKNRGAIYVEERMVLKSNYYSRAQLARLGALAQVLERTEATLLREALADLVEKYREVT